MPLASSKKNKPHSSITHSSSSVLKGFIQLLRPLNAVMSMIGVYIGYSLAIQAFEFNHAIFYSMLAVFFISGGGQAINDYYDYEIDKKKKSNRPLANGTISKKIGFIYAICLFALGILLASFVNENSLWIAAFFSALLFLYSALAQKIKFMGNIIVALSVGFTYIFGAVAAEITPLVLMIALPAFFANWAREIIKDVEDQNEDKGHKISLAHVLKPNQVNWIVGIILFLAFFTGYFPVIFGNASLLFAGLITISNIVFILATKELLEKRAGKSASFMKKGMLVALLAQLSLLV